MPFPILIAYLSASSVLIPLTFCFFIKGKIAQEIKILIIILMMSFLCDGLSLIFIRYSINTHPIGNFYLFVQFSLLYYLFYLRLNSLRVLRWVSILFGIGYTMNLIFFQGFLRFNSYSNVGACILIIGMSLSYFYMLVKEMPTPYINRLPFLWIAFAALTYYGGNLFLFLLGDYLTTGFGGSRAFVWILHNFLNITKNILFAIAVWQTCRSPKSFI